MCEPLGGLVWLCVLGCCCMLCGPLAAQQGSVGMRLGMGCSRFPWQQQGGARKHQLRKEGCSCAREPEGLAEQAPGAVCAIARRSYPWLHPVPPVWASAAAGVASLFRSQCPVPGSEGPVLFPPSWLLVGLSVSPAQGCVLAHMGIPAPGVQWPPGGPGPHSPAGPGDSPQLLGSREGRAEPQGGHQPLGPAAMVTSGFDGTTRGAAR